MPQTLSLLLQTVAELGTTVAPIIAVLLPLVTEEIGDVVRSISPKHIRQRVIEEIAQVLVMPIPEQTVLVKSLKNRVAPDQELATTRVESGSSQSSEQVERQRSRADGFLANHKTIELLSDGAELLRQLGRVSLTES